jgi:hypothetical protein
MRSLATRIRRGGGGTTPSRGRKGGILITALTAGLIASVMMTFSGTAARAATVPQSVVKVGMHVVGFNAKIAAAHGYVIRRAADGQEYAVKKGIRPADNPVVSGNCGVSYVYEYGIGNSAVELYTGYSVEYDGVTAVIESGWRVQLDDRGGTSYKSWNPAGTPANGIWQVDLVVGRLTKGGARATVNPGNSFVILANGAYCSSGGPWSSTTIT